MRIRFFRLVALAAVGAISLTACGGGAGAGDDQVAQGRAAFEANCAACHGLKGVGSTTGPPLVHEIYEPSHHGDDSFRAAVTRGVTPHHWDFGPMPAFPSVSDEEIEAIIGYVRTLQREAGIE